MSDVNYLQIVLTAFASGLFAFFGVFMNNRITESKKKKSETEVKVQELTLDNIKTAFRLELADQLRDLKADSAAVKQNQSNLVTELRTLGVIKETPVLK